LFVAFNFELPNPSWAVLTVFITSQPLTQGGVWGKAFYRVVGTVIALTVTLIVIPNLIDAPELMMFVLAAWLGVCLFFSLLDRSPRAYAFLLSGYTTILVGLPVITGDPSTIFDTAIARTEEILVGVGSAALVHGLFSLHSARGAFLAKVEQTLGDARNWITSAIAGLAPPEERRARRRLASDISELVNLAMALRFEFPEVHVRFGLIRTLEDRLIALLPLLTAVEARREALWELGPLDPRIVTLAQDVADWVRAPSPDNETFERLMQACEQLTPEVDADSSTKTLLELSLVHRITLLAGAWRDCTELARFVREPHRPIDARFAAALDNPTPRRLHVDPGIAFWSALVAALSVGVSAAFGMLLEWPPAVTTIALAAVLCSLFATFDDPTPPQARLLVWALVAIPISAGFVFAILPALDGFIELALCLGPLYFVFGYFMAQPKFALQAVAVMLVTTTLMAVQPSYRADFVTFAAIATASILGIVIGLVLTRLLRVISADVSTRRLLRRGWADLAALARKPLRQTLPQFAMRTLDRLSLLTPRTPRAAPSYELCLNDTLRDLQIGFNLSELATVAAQLPDAYRRSLRALHAQLGAYFDALSEGAAESLSKPSMDEIETVTHELLTLPRSALRDRGVAAAVGLRQNLLSVHRQTDTARNDAAGSAA
jgi:uncharacterized membrane protein YccC